MRLLPCCLEDSILPVGTDTEDRWVAIYRVWLGDFALVGEVIVIFCKLAQVHDIQALVLSACSYATGIGKLSFACLTLLGSNQNDTIGTLSTIDSSSRSILQYLHAHDIARVDQRERRYS